MKINWQIEEFSLYKDKINRNDFDCGNDSLNEFIKTKASQYEKNNYTKIYLAIEEKNKLFGGYYSLSASSVILSVFPESTSKSMPKHSKVPVALLGKLAVNKEFQGQKLGSFLLIDAMDKIKRLSSDIGVFAIEVDAIDNVAKSFYTHFGFESLLDDKNHMYLTIKKIKRLFK